MTERRWLAFAGACLAGTGLLRLILKWREADGFPGDRWAMHHLDSTHAPGWAVDLGHLFSALGTPIASVVTVGLACWFAGREAGPQAAALIVLAYAGVLVNALLKWVSGPTPLMLERAPDALNYPSGHTVYAAAVFGAFALLAARRGRVDIAAACALVIVAMGPLRVIVETHFVSDVIAGYLVGFGWLAFAGVLTGWLPGAAGGGGGARDGGRDGGRRMRT